MLRKALLELAAGDVYSRADLAKRLGISVGLLAQMMEDLVRKGYLKPISTASGGSGGCGSCPLSRTCAQGESAEPRGWVLTEKGLAAARR